MSPKNNTLTPTVTSDLVITRIFQASRAVVFKLWTEPHHLALWWGPRGFTNPVCTVDVRVGGAISIDMKGPDGIVYPMTGVFEDVIAEERIVFTANALDENGELGLIVRNTITFEDNAGYTKLTLLAQVTKVTTQGERYLAGMQEG